MSDTPFFVWLTPLDYKGEPQAQRAYNTNHIIDIGPGLETEYEDFRVQYDGELERTNPRFRTRTYTPGAVVFFAIGGGDGGSWTLTVEEQAADIVRSIRCNRPQVSAP
jgi:hypothetical protein